MKNDRYKIIYDDLFSCPECKAVQLVSPIVVEEGLVVEAETSCTNCEHKAYWAYGFYASGKKE